MLFLMVHNRMFSSLELLPSFPYVRDVLHISQKSNIVNRILRQANQIGIVAVLVCPLSNAIDPSVAGPFAVAASIACKGVTPASTAHQLCTS